MAKTPDSNGETSRRRFGAELLGLALLTLALPACGDIKSTPRDPDRKPFWEREEQRDD
jgi:hypothetical protein